MRIVDACAAVGSVEGPGNAVKGDAGDMTTMKGEGVGLWIAWDCGKVEESCGIAWGAC